MASQEDVLTFTEIMQEYPEEWVAVRVADRDANGQPLSGVVAGHNKDKRSVRQDTMNEKELCIFYAGLTQTLVMI